MSVQLLLIDDDTSVSSGITQAPRLHERSPPSTEFATFMPGSSSLQFNSHAYGKMLIYVHFN